MTEPPTTLLSVRGDAHVEVAPDLATLHCMFRLYAGSKADALRSATAALDAALVELRRSGGAPRAAGEERRSLTWTAYSATTRVETEWTEKGQRQLPTGRIVASVALRIEVRDFGLLNAVAGVLSRYEDLHVMEVGWSVDDDNPAWPQVRAAAIAAAIRQGRDYAAALGGSLARIEHVADAGLLDGDSGNHGGRRLAVALSGARYAEEGETPSLDPVPQDLVAVIEARFTASVGPLA